MSRTLSAPSAPPATPISGTGGSQRRDTVVTALLTGLLGVGLLAAGLVVGAGLLWLAMSVIM